MTAVLTGRVALVTGASSGIGEATALALAASGASVALSARREQRLHQLVQRIESHGGKALALPGDVVDEAVATATVEKTITHFGRIDILVNSAGIIQAGGVENVDTDEYRRVIGINGLVAATAIVQGRVVATWKRAGDADIALAPLRALADAEHEGIQRAAQRRVRGEVLRNRIDQPRCRLPVLGNAKRAVERQKIGGQRRQIRRLP